MLENKKIQREKQKVLAKHMPFKTWFVHQLKQNPGNKAICPHFFFFLLKN